MSNVTLATIATLKAMNDARISGEPAAVRGTVSLVATLTKGMAALRAEDAAWWGVKLVQRMLPPSEWVDGERGGTVKIVCWLEIQNGPPKGVTAALMRAHGMLPKGIPTEKPQLSEEENERLGKELAETDFNNFPVSPEQLEMAKKLKEARDKGVSLESTLGSAGFFKEKFGF